MKKSIFPNFFKFGLLNIVVLILILLVYRIVGWWYFFPKEIHEKNSELLQAYTIGFRFDIRVAVIGLLPIVILGILLRNTFFIKNVFKKIYLFYIGILLFLINVVYAFDIGNYLYLKERIDTGIFKFAGDMNTSLGMMWESYPMVKILIGFVVVWLLEFLLFKAIYNLFEEAKDHFKKAKTILFSVLLVLICAFGIYNSVGSYPLRWSQIPKFSKIDLTKFTLNPIENFYRSTKTIDLVVDREEVQKYYTVIADYLGIENRDSLNFKREYRAIKNDLPQKKNIVIIMMESLGAPTMKTFGNPTNASPFLDELAKESWFFKDFYVPRYGTAPTVFASITGLPDIIYPGTASRVSQITNQRVIFDQLQGVDKMYFLGGNANWANIRGLFSGNVKDIEIFEEGSYGNLPKVDVWGVGDYDLLQFANKEFEKKNADGKNFVAYLQTSAYHPPYTVPDDERGFKPLSHKEMSEAQAQEGGFESLAQLNSLRYFDHNLKLFFESAKKSSYFDNTVFVLFGDHNGHAVPYTYMEKPEYETGFGDNHVPLFIYGKDIPAKQDTMMAQIYDLFPTVADLLKQPYNNYTLGRSILRRKEGEEEGVFFYKSFDGVWSSGILNRDMFFYYDPANKEKSMKIFRYTKEQEAYKEDIGMQIKAETFEYLPRAFYNSTMYLYFNNKNE